MKRMAAFASRHPQSHGPVIERSGELTFKQRLFDQPDHSVNLFYGVETTVTSDIRAITGPAFASGPESSRIT
jgi:hypothetical protein